MTTQRPRRAPWVFITALVVLLSWTGATIIGSLSPSAISGRSPSVEAVQDVLTALSPQRWEFFTASPEKAEFVAYRTTSLQSAMSLPQTKASNLFGLSRTQRAQGPELAILAQQVHRWTKCDSPGDPSACLKRAQTANVQDLGNKARYRTLCGKLILAEVEPTPFAFRMFHYPDSSVKKTATVTVSCS